MTNIFGFCFLLLLMKVPFHTPSLGAEEIDEVVATLRSGWLTTGQRSKQFEQAFGRYLGHRHAVAVNSCTAALHLALEAVGVKTGDAVVVPTMTFAASAEVVRYFGADPLLVDCRADDFNLDVADAERRILKAQGEGQRVVAIIPVHYGGQVGDVEGVAELARKYNLKVVEDAAHCCPAYYREGGAGGSGRRTEDGGGKTKDNGGKMLDGRKKIGRGKDRRSKTDAPPDSTAQQSGEEGPVAAAQTPNSGLRTSLLKEGWKPVGTSADISCFSFYANKCITTGEGGMACTERDDYAERMRIMSLHGISKDAWKRFSADGSWFYEIIAPGFKYNLTDIAAAIGIHQVRRADELHRKRQAVAALYSEGLQDVEGLVLPRELPKRIHSWHLYAIRLALDRLGVERADVIEDLKKRGIGTSVHWMPLHMHPYYRDKYGYKPQDLPVAAGLYPQMVTLPLFPEMTEDQVGYVCRGLKEILARNPKPRRPFAAD